MTKNVPIKMTPSELVSYYLKNSNEFMAEDPHDKLLSILEDNIRPITNMDKQIVSIDVGSCVGEYIQHLRSICYELNTKIICVEPNPANLPVLNNKAGLFDNVIVEDCCISDVPGIASFFNWRDKQENHMKNEVGSLRAGGHKICDVDVKRLDTILDNHFGENADIIIKFVKIDTEGNDGNVIKSMGTYLHKVQYMIFECSDCLDDHRGPGIDKPMKDIVEHLSRYNFDVYRIGTKKLFRVNDEYWDDMYDTVKFWSNCFAIKKNDPFIHTLIDEEFNYL